MAFWIASPSMDPEIYALSAAQLGFPVATARLIGALVLSFGAGLIVLALERRGRFADPLIASTEKKAPHEELLAGGGDRSGDRVLGGEGDRARDRGRRRRKWQRWQCCRMGAAVPPKKPSPLLRPVAAPPPRGTTLTTTAPHGAYSCGATSRTSGPHEILKEIVSDSLILGKWLLLAIVLEALIVRYVPTDVVSGILGTDGVLSVLVAGLISVPLYLNGVGAIPVVEGLMDQGMVAAAGVTFLLGGAITTIPAMVAVKSVVKTKVFAFYLGVGLLGSVGIGLVALPLL